MDKNDEPSLTDLVKELQKQVQYLERKIDTLLAQSAGRDVSSAKYSRLPREFNRDKRFSGAKSGDYYRGKRSRSNGKDKYDRDGRDNQSRYKPKKRSAYRPGDNNKRK